MDRTQIHYYIVFNCVVAFVNVLGNATPPPKQDPCSDNSTRDLSFLRQRVVGYQLAEGESPICDQYFYKGWYQMFDNVIASNETGCGTVINWYRKGTLPQDVGKEVSIDYCLNTGNGGCGMTETGHVMKCSDTKYVFELLPLPACAHAYCIEPLHEKNTAGDSAPDISSVVPVIEVEVKRVQRSNELNFYCDFTPPKNTNYFYTVEWGITSGIAWTDSLFVSNAVQYSKQKDFREKTKLTETTLKVRNFARLGIRIACLVKAMHSPTGTVSEARPSAPKYCGIEIVNKSGLKLKNTETGTFDIRLTVPFGCQPWDKKPCALDVTMYIPENSDNCRPTGLSQAEQTDRVKNRCGIKIKSNETGVAKPIRVEAELGQNRVNKDWEFAVILATAKTYAAHPFFQNHVLDMVKVGVSAEMNRIKGTCYSNNDPHMGFFDRVNSGFDNQNEGIFLLYRNVDQNVQVQMQTSQCYKGDDRIWCNCGVAINAGRDVFTMNSCDTGKWLNEFRCKDKVLAESIKTDKSKQKYVVYLPTGTEVQITLSGGFFRPFLNIQVTPNLADWNKTDGLCGLFNGNANDDRFKRPGSAEKDINRSWLVKSNENLFDKKNDKHLKRWSSEKWLCNCPVEFAPENGASGPENYVQCSAQKSKVIKCKDKIFEENYNARCSITRPKRNVHGHLVQTGVDKHFTASTSYRSRDATTNNDYFQRLKRDENSENYTHATAQRACLQILNTTAFQMCSKVPTLNVNKYVDECVLDALATNSMEWTGSHLDSMKDECVQEVKVNQPLTEEDLKGFQPDVNDTLDTNETVSTPNPTKPTIVSPVFTPDFLDDLEDVTCLNDCSNNGICTNSLCTCNAGFTGADCSVDSSQPPVMAGIPDNGECDLQYRECLKTSVFGRNLVQSSTLSCNIKPFQIDENNDVKKGKNSYKNEGVLETFMEVSCPLTNTREKRALHTETTDYIAKGYRVSISNDGVMFSEEDIIVIFNSECVNCTKTNDKITCTQRPEYCIKDGQCFKFGETYDCYECTSGINKRLEWVPGKDCPMAVPPPQPKKLWVIAAVLGPVAVVLVVITLGCVYKSQRTIAKKKTRVMDRFLMWP